MHINRSTYLPEVPGRAFETLSSQGLKTLVNIAPALAHHTVAIDRGLPLPGLLILDGNRQIVLAGLRPWTSVYTRGGPQTILRLSRGA